MVDGGSKPQTFCQHSLIMFFPLDIYVFFSEVGGCLMFTSHSVNLRGETEVLARFEMEWDAYKAVERVIGRMMGDENMHFQMAINESDP